MESKFVLKRVLYLFIQKFEVFKEVLRSLVFHLR